MNTQTSPNSRKRRRIVSRRTLLFGGLGAATTFGGGAAWALDRYIIDHVEVGNTSSITAPNARVMPPDRAGTRTATSYTSKTAQVSIKTVRTGSGKDKLVYFVTDVKVADATIIKSAFANDQFGRNITANTSEIAASAQAVVAINGDYCGFRDDGIVIRNGVAYRDKGARQAFAIYTDGTARLYDETATTAAKLIEEGVWITLSFGPALLDASRIQPDIDKYEISDFGPVPHGSFGSIQGRQPRTGIGLVDKNHYVMIVANGRGAEGSRGVSMTEFATMFLEAGATMAYNLDGGGSSTLVFGDKVVNTPAWRGGKQRGTSDIVYVAG